MPTVAIYVAAALTTVAAAVAFKQFVYEPHIAPTVERWTEEFVNEVRARRRQRLEHNLEMSVSAGGVSDYTRPRNVKVERERRSKAASDWRQLTDSVNELEKDHEQVGSTSAIGDSVVTTGLRRRTAGPMDESIESLLFAPMSPSAGSHRSEPVVGAPPAMSPPITCPMPLVRNPSNQSVSTLFSASSSSPSSQPAALPPASDRHHSTRSPRALSPFSDSGTGSPSLYASAVFASPPANPALFGAQSPRSPFSDFTDEVNPWVNLDRDASADPPAFARSRTLSASELIQDNTPQIPTLDIGAQANLPPDDEVFSLVDSDSDGDPSDVGSDAGSDGSDDFTQLLAASGELSQSSWTRVDDRSML